MNNDMKQTNKERKRQEPNPADPSPVSFVIGMKKEGGEDNNLKDRSIHDQSIEYEYVQVLCCAVVHLFCPFVF